MEDPHLRGGPARSRRVHVEHVLEGAEPQPWTARVHPLHPPSHSQQGLTLCRWNNSKMTVFNRLLLMCSFYFLILAAVPLGRRNQKPFPQPACERPSWWLWGSRRVKPLSRPPTRHRDQSSLSVCHRTTSPFTVYSQFVVAFTSMLVLSTWSTWTNCSSIWTIKQNVHLNWIK